MTSSPPSSSSLIGALISSDIMRPSLMWLCLVDEYSDIIWHSLVWLPLAAESLWCLSTSSDIIRHTCVMCFWPYSLYLSILINKYPGSGVEPWTYIYMCIRKPKMTRVRHYVPVGVAVGDIVSAFLWGGDTPVCQGSCSSGCIAWLSVNRSVSSPGKASICPWNIKKIHDVI